MSMFPNEYTVLWGYSPSLVMLGVMNIHCGNWFLSMSCLNMVRGFVLANLSVFCATESYSTAGLCLRTYMLAPVLGFV
jgi:hypothetical protein